MLAVVCVCVCSHIAWADPAPTTTDNPTPPLVGLGDVYVWHDLYANGSLDNPKAGTEAGILLGPVTGTWTLTVQNTSSVNWDDFHFKIVITPGIGVNWALQFVPACDVTSGFGATPGTPIALALSSPRGGIFDTNADLNAGMATAVVPPGGQATFTLNVKDTGWSNWYHLKMEASAPEPSTLLQLGSGILGMSGFLRKRLLNRS